MSTTTERARREDIIVKSVAEEACCPDSVKSVAEEAASRDSTRRASWPATLIVWNFLPNDEQPKRWANAESVQFEEQ